MIVFQKVTSTMYAQKDLNIQTGSYIILNEEIDKKQLNISEAIKNQASFIFTNNTIELSNYDAFSKSIKLIITEVFNGGRGILWIKDTNNISLTNLIYMGINISGNSIRESTNIEISNNVSICILSATSLFYDDNKFYIDSNGIKFYGYHSQSSFKIIGKANISFDSVNCGCLLFDMTMSYSDFIDFFKPGIEFTYEINNQISGKNFNVFTKRYDLNLKQIYFKFHLFPCDIYNLLSKNIGNNHEIYNSHLSYMMISNDDEDIKFQSCYSDIFGNLIELKSISDNNTINLTSRFVFNRTYDNNGHCISPEGDYIININKDIKMICGLSGTEFFNITKNSFIRFISGMPAFIPDIEAKKISVGQTDNPYKDKIKNDYMSSWIAIKNEIGINYTSQAKELILYEYDKENVLKHCITKINIPFKSDILYPMLPYSLVDFNNIDKNTTPQIINKLEHFIISSIRMNKIFKQNSYVDSINNLTKVSTPNGYIIELENGVWKNIYLSENENSKVYFEQPNNNLIQAFSSESVFIVSANTLNIGSCSYESNPCKKQSFHCNINIQNWRVRPNIGNNSTYGNYYCVMIIKACKGKIYNTDKPIESLCANTSMWTQRADFSSPLVNNKVDESQQLLLSKWLCDYFQKAYKMDSEYFNYFNSIISDENWNGILFLNVPLIKGDMPETLLGVFGSLSSQDICYHHFGIEINPIKIINNLPMQLNQSNLFGLLYYEDNLISNGIIKPVPPSNNSDYDFKILSLKALFKNSAVENFESYAQLTLNKIFNTTVSSCINNYNCIILQGYMQNTNGVSSFNMKNDSKVVFGMQNTIKNVCITSAEMLPLDIKIGSSKVMLQGYIDFERFKDNNNFIDLLSFGDENEGLYFNNLQLNIENTITVHEENIKFDMIKSNARINSFYSCMPLKINKMLSGSKKEITNKYMDMSYSININPLKEGSCHAIEFEINLGSSGELSNNSILNGKMIIAWADNAKELYMGINILGINQEGLTIQDIIKITADKAELTFNNNVYNIVISNLSLKLLGIAKLPTGNPLTMYIFSSKDSKSCGWFSIRHTKKAGDEIV